jgi:PKD repeat protein
VVSKSGVLKGRVPFKVVFDASKSSIKNALEWQWDFENDGISDGFTVAVEKVFRKPGLYEVKLTIIDADEKHHELIQKVDVARAGIQARIKANPVAGAVPLKVDFDGSGSFSDEGVIVDYIWEFPKTKPIHYGAQISRMFKQLGNHEIKLTILTSTGKTSTTTTIISARTPVVKSDFEFTPQRGFAPLKVFFDPAKSTGIIDDYFWDFGDGYTSHEFTPTHTYHFPGTYTVNLQVTDPNGLVDDMPKVIVVKKKK